MASLPQCKFPVIDFSVKNLNPGSDSWTKTCGEVTRALEEYGCFIALYDQVSRSSTMQRSLHHKRYIIFLLKPKSETL
ncbi:hypothetical protein HanOQP8_Chr01g0026951 [Helianthus annuus]|nr:hypothetical protein HanOQP8_Chr01g0026951 [Helianthus annuus]